MNTIKFKTTGKLEGNTPLIFFLCTEDRLAKYPLFKYLEKEEQNYLLKLEKTFSLQEKESRILVPPTGRKLIFIGTGKKGDLSAQKVSLIPRIAVSAARREKIKHLAFFAAPLGSPLKTKAFYETLAANFVLANFEFTKYKTPPKEGFHFISEIQALVSKPNKSIEDGLLAGQIIGEETNNCRTLSNTPGGDMTPAILARHALEDANGLAIKISILEDAEMKKLGMGGVLGVSKGSAERPKFIVLEYYGAGKSRKPTVLVGKGVTFDTGGLNLKPTEAIYEMHMDMSGGSAVMHAIRAAARLKLKKNIVGLIPAVENMPSGSSYHPGDVLRTMSGKTIEVLNTDAEGRVILADALEYAKKFRPALVVDVATLTGASMIALGKRFIGLFTLDAELEKLFRKIGDESGERVWPLPISSEFEEEIRGTFGDWANTGKGRHGDASNAAVFLWQFTKDVSGKPSYPWVHLDIAPRMTTTEGEYLSKGSAGAGVRLLVRLLQEI